MNTEIPTAGKIQAFRTYAFNLAEQFLSGALAEEYVNALCVEYEREVNVMYNDVINYRNELARVAELLGRTVEREKLMHQMLETIVDLTANHYGSSKNGQQESYSTETELKRILDMLSVPLIAEDSNLKHMSSMASMNRVAPQTMQPDYATSRVLATPRSDYVPAALAP